MQEVYPLYTERLQKHGAVVVSGHRVKGMLSIPMQLQCLMGKGLQCPLRGDWVDRKAPEGVSFLLVEFLSSVKIILLLLLLVMVTVVT